MIILLLVFNLTYKSDLGMINKPISNIPITE